ncbi:MAG: bifunctional hydroxymethylpyrimidine kinase/phosphomethylpyrimidine kinase [Pirellulales bacterium]|nr:bifunctional hydroxymethylpyrimidine kinase/phosphomethylpyrimidine kinase [Pirellulales bacterium]
MILTAGLTPAWQQVLVFDTFHLGEVNRAQEARWCASGKVCNAGVAAHLLGGPSLTLAAAGGYPLVEMNRDFDRLGVPRRWVRTQAATRVCTTVLDRATGTITELVENGRPLMPSELEEFRAAYAQEAAKAEFALIMGSLPSGVPETFYRDLVERTRSPVALDFRGRGLLSVLDLKPFVVKPNRDELALTIGRPLDSDAELFAAMQSLNRGGAQWVVITHGSEPVWITSQAAVYRVFPPPVQDVVNPIGCGDVLAAAIAHATLEGYDLVRAVRLGVAAAAANLRNLLPGRFDPSRIEHEAALVRVEEGPG